MLRENKAFEGCVTSLVKAKDFDSDSEEESNSNQQTNFAEFRDNQAEDDQDSEINYSQSEDSSDSENEQTLPKLSIFGSTWTFLNQIITRATREYLTAKTLPVLKTTVNEQKRIEIFTNLAQSQVKILSRQFMIEEFDLEVVKTLDLQKIASVVVVRLICVLFSLKLKENKRFRRNEFLLAIGLDEMQLNLLLEELWKEILQDNSGTILALDAIGSASFGVGAYSNQLKVFEEKLKLVEEKAKKDVALAEERAKKESLQLLYNIFTQEEYKDAKKKLLAQNKDEK